MEQRFGDGVPPYPRDGVTQERQPVDLLLEHEKCSGDHGGSAPLTATASRNTLQRSLS